MSAASETISYLPAIDRRLLIAVLMPCTGRMEPWQSACINALAACGEVELVAHISDRQHDDALQLPSANGPVHLDHWPPHDKRIQKDCDVVLAFQTGCDAAVLPPLGRWELRHGGIDPAEGECPGYRELVAGRSSIVVEWIATSGDPRTVRVLHRAVLHTCLTPHKTRDALLRAAPALLVGAVRRVRVGAYHSHLAATAPALPARPSLSRVAAAWLRTFAHRAKIRWLQNEIWTVGILPIPVSAILAGKSLPQPIWLDPPRKGQFYADPFPVKTEGHAHVLFETWSDQQARGWVSTASLEPPYRLADAETAIDFGHHMSYPSIFQFDGATWCAPEVAEAGGLHLLRMGRSPNEWFKVKEDLPGVPLIDPTLFEHDGRWWLFASLLHAQDELHAWYAASPLGSWQPHTLNPLKTDVGSARPAGATFRKDGALYRPGQDCTDTYGQAVVLHHVRCLDPERFEEIAMVRVEPSSNWLWRHGLHTFNLLDDSVIIDAKRHSIRPKFLLRLIRTRRRQSHRL